MGAIDGAMVSKILNALTPTGVGGIPGTALVALNSGTMFLLLTSTASTEATAGTQITNGTGYTTNGIAFSTQSAASAAGTAVTCPHTTAISWTSSGSNFLTIVSGEIQDHVQLRVWYFNWNGQPIAVANGNTFQVAAEAISVSLT